MGEVEGTILTIDSVSVTIETADGNMVVPSKQLIEEQVLILKKPKEE